MSEENITKPSTDERAPKQGFFTRIFSKVDSAMKAKAESKGSDCCGGGKSGGKCC